MCYDYTTTHRKMQAARCLNSILVGGTLHIRKHLFERKVAHDLFEVLVPDVMTYDDILFSAYHFGMGSRVPDTVCLFCQCCFRNFPSDFFLILGFRFFHINYLRDPMRVKRFYVRCRSMAVFFL